MSRHCPSCGSTVRDEDILCPVCGEKLDTAATGTPVPAIPSERTIPTAAPADPAPRQAPAGATGKAITCPDCGAQNEPDATECTVCGSPLAATAAVAPAPEQPQPQPRRAIPSSAARDYLLSTVAAVVIGAIVLLVSTPEEKTGPPMPAGEHGAPGAQMPQGHPPAATPPQPTAQQLQQVTDAEKAVAANPADLEAKLKLANLYYDIDRHAEAVPLYREYVKVHPENLSARTDMAFSIASSSALDSGIVELHSVLAKDPKFQNAVYNLAMMYIAKRNRDSTLYWLQRTVEIDPNSRPGKFAAEVLNGVKSGALDDSTGTSAR